MAGRQRLHVATRPGNGPHAETMGGPSRSRPLPAHDVRQPAAHGLPAKLARAARGRVCSASPVQAMGGEMGRARVRGCRAPEARRSAGRAAGEDRAHDLRIMRPTRYQLRYCRICTRLGSCSVKVRDRHGPLADEMDLPVSRHTIDFKMAATACDQPGLRQHRQQAETPGSWGEVATPI